LRRTDPNVPWDLTYRYTGYISTTGSGRACLAWHDLDWHWRRPLSDLERAGCRSLPDYVEGRPGCFYAGGLGVPEEDWRFEECDIPVCEVDCARYRNIKEVREIPNIRSDIWLGSLVECTPAMQASGVRFPAVTCLSALILRKYATLYKFLCS
jgi:hypothetical protein